MNYILRMEIPRELKEKFSKDRVMLEDKECAHSVLLGNVYARIIYSCLNNNDFINVLKKLENVTTHSEYGYVDKKGFYEEYPLWVEFALMKIMNKYNIDFSDKYQIQDMYSSLFQVQDSICSLEKYRDLYDKEYIIDHASYFVNKRRMRIQYDSQKVKDMCRIFVNIALSSENVFDDVDISYKTFCEETKGASYSKKQ